MCDLKNNGDESIYKTETDSRLRKQIFGDHRGKGGVTRKDKLGAWDQRIHTTLCVIDNQ